MLIASAMVVLWAMSSEACHRRRAYSSAGTARGATYAAVLVYAGPAGYYGGPGAATPRPGAYYGGGYPGGTAGYPGGYDFGRPGYNPGGLGGPASGLGVRPGLGVGGFGPGSLTGHEGAGPLGPAPWFVAG